jgi:hypothetical protein
MRRAAITSLAVACLVAAPTQTLAGSGSWQRLEPVPGQGVEGMSVAAVSTGEVVAAFGYRRAIGADTVETRVYDIVSDSWHPGATAPQPGRSEGTAVARGSFLYAIGGRGGPEGILADLDRYDAFRDSWRSLADMPTARAGLAAAMLGHSIYAIGGRLNGGGPCSGREVDSVERYDIASDTWVTLAPLPRARSDAAAAAVNGKIYVFGGCRIHPQTGELIVLRRVDIYSPRSNTWSSAPLDLPRKRAAFYQVAALHHNSPEPKVYVIGGWDGVRPGVSTVFIYNVTTNSYSRGEPMPTHRAEMGVAAFGGRVYAVGGAQPAFGSSVDAMEVYRP